MYRMNGIRVRKCEEISAGNKHATRTHSISFNQRKRSARWRPISHRRVFVVACALRSRNQGVHIKLTTLTLNRRPAFCRDSKVSLLTHSSMRSFISSSRLTGGARSPRHLCRGALFLPRLPDRPRGRHNSEADTYILYRCHCWESTNCATLQSFRSTIPKLNQ